MKFSLFAVVFPLLAAAAPASEQQQETEPSTPLRFGVMSARSASPVHLLPMAARGRHFWLGGPTQTYCPEQVGKNCPPGKDTVIAGLSSLDVMVPGGQMMYVEPNGAVGFTQAHSASIPAGSFIGGFTYTAGPSHGTYGFTGWGATGFIACPSPTSQYYQVFANIQNATVPSGNVNDCLGFSAMAFPYTAPHSAAWQYI